MIKCSCPLYEGQMQREADKVWNFQSDLPQFFGYSRKLSYLSSAFSCTPARQATDHPELYSQVAAGTYVRSLKVVSHALVQPRQEPFKRTPMIPMGSSLGTRFANCYSSYWTVGSHRRGSMDSPTSSTCELPLPRHHITSSNSFKFPLACLDQTATNPRRI